MSTLWRAPTWRYEPGRPICAWTPCAASFHGGLASQVAKEQRRVATRVLVLHGADDPTIPAAQVQAFQQEMRDARADWQFVSYGGAVHSFSNPEANSAAARYDERAAVRSWAAATAFLKEVLAS